MSLAPDRLVLAAGCLMAPALGWVAVTDPKLGVVGLAALPGFMFLVALPRAIPTVCLLALTLEVAGSLGVRLAGVPLTAAKLVALASIFAWVLHCVQARKQPFHILPVTLPLVLLNGAAVASLWWSRDPNTGRTHLVSLALLTILVHMIAEAVDSKDLSQFRVEISTSAGILIVGVVAQAVFQDGRGTGSFADPNLFGYTLVLLCPAVIGMADQTTTIGRTVRSSVLIALIIGALSTQSRSTLIVMMLIGPGILWMMRDQRRTVLVALVAAAVFAFLILDFQTLGDRYGTLVDQDTGSDDGSFNERLRALNFGVRLAKTSALTGVGVGQFTHMFMQYSGYGYLRAAHNSYVDIVAEQGLFGLAAWGNMAFWVARTLRSMRNATPARLDQNLAVGLMLSMMGTLIFGLFLDIITKPLLFLTFGLIALFSKSVIQRSTSIDV